MITRFAIGLAASFALGGAAMAVPTAFSVLAGNDCGGPSPRNGAGFSNCYAFGTTSATLGTSQFAPGTAPVGSSRTVFRDNNGDLDSISSRWDSIAGDEFGVSFSGRNNVLTVTYNQGINDPAIFYVAIKQANEFALLYFAGGLPSTQAFDLDTLGLKNPNGWSHVTFFNGDSSGPGGSDPAITVPTPAAGLLFGLGLLGLAATRHRKSAMAT
jgi:hypothetical protein